MRTVYLGTSDFAVTVLERLAASPWRPALVITRPDRPKGRGRKLSSPPVATAARGLGIDVHQPDNVNADEPRARIASLAPDAMLICAFGALIREPLLSDYEWLNAHPSLLPRWRGAAPVERAIDAGDEQTGVSIMRPTAEMDAGPVCLRRDEPIAADDTYGTLAPRLARLGGELLVEALDTRPAFEDQPDDGVTFADKITAEDRRLDPARTPAELERRVRALSPHIGAWVELPEGDRMGVLSARATTTEIEPGRLHADDGRLLFGCAGGALELLEVKPPGGRAMASGAWIRGHAGSVR
ncbi:MAG: methionyl-tRNA formyltransferase [Actinomycetota bacterium]|nr:methionyl-tRNA formyltransferase [Actinomycetota bacterium]